jgi:hypothetical protein
MMNQFHQKGVSTVLGERGAPLVAFDRRIKKRHGNCANEAKSDQSSVFKSTERGNYQQVTNLILQKFVRVTLERLVATLLFLPSQISTKIKNWSNTHHAGVAGLEVAGVVQHHYGASIHKSRLLFLQKHEGDVFEKVALKAILIGMGLVHHPAKIIFFFKSLINEARCASGIACVFATASSNFTPPALPT